MNSFFKRFRLGKKIGGGFGVVILLLIVVSIVAWDGINTVVGGFIEYRALARDTNLAGRLQANMLMVRMNVKDFIITQSDKDREQYAEYYEKMNEFLKEAESEIQNPKRRAILDQYGKDILAYDEGFHEVCSLYAERDRLVDEILLPVGISIEQNLTTLMKSAKEDGDVEVAYDAGIALRYLLLGRLYAQKFLTENKVIYRDRVGDEFDLLIEEVDALEVILEYPEKKTLNNEIRASSVQYLECFDQIAATIEKRNDIINNTLDALGPVMAKAVEDVKLSVKADQDVLGPLVQAKGKSASLLVIVVSIVASCVAIFAAIFITKMIVNPVQKVGTFVAELASGDFTTTIEYDSEDELGHMVTALSGMGASLRDGFKLVQEGVNNMASSTTELSVISTQLASNADTSSGISNTVAAASEQTSHNMSTVAASVEQMSANLRSVATASEEMTATIEEIAKNTDRGRSVTQVAVEKVSATSKQMNELGAAANLIGSITDTIKGISEQTNLLALNATIEAASAGEAGKGFAVVANEIKELSRQTAQATEQISGSIENIQQSTDVSIKDIAGIVGIIEEIDQITSMIASAVEEQSNTTNEIATNVSQTADGVQEVARNVAEVNEVSRDIAKDVSKVNQASVEIAGASTQLNSSASELSEFAEKLNEVARKYKVV